MQIKLHRLPSGCCQWRVVTQEGRAIPLPAPMKSSAPRSITQGVDDELVMAVLIDSGFLFASLNASESEHQATIRVLENIRGPIVLPVPAITEIAYLLARDINNEAAANFVASLCDDRTNSRESSSRRLLALRRDSPAVFRRQGRFCRHADRCYSRTSEHHARSHT